MNLNLAITFLFSNNCNKKIYFKIRYDGDSYICTALLLLVLYAVHIFYYKLIKIIIMTN